MTTGQKISTERKKLGLTQEQLAEKIYVSRNAVSKWETGKGYPSLDSLKILSDLFGVTIDQLLSDEELKVTKLADEKQAKLFYVLAVICIAVTVAFAFAAYFTKLPLLLTGGLVSVAGYLLCAFYTTPKYKRAQRYRQNPAAYIVSRLAVALILATVVISQLFQMI